MSTATSVNSDNEGSTDIVIVDCNDALLTSLGDLAEKPLMMLFVRLIGNDTKQNTVLTNAQITDILQKEFDMDIMYTHELAIEIYLNLLKRFLKDWPQWDDFDFAINTLKDQKDILKMRDMLHTNYEGLKNYLKQTLDAVKPLLNSVIKEVIENTKKKSEHTSDDVALFIQCTRNQLNNLFFRRPHPDQNHTILNCDSGLSKIRVQPYSLESLLNWPSIRISLSLNGLLYKREIKHTMKHLLVNKKLNYDLGPPEYVKTNLQVKAAKATNFVEKKNFLDLINRISDTVMVKTDNNQLKDGVKIVCDILRSDLDEAPQFMQSPASYRQNLSRSPYVRYLCAEVYSDKFTVNNYDLQLQETMIPQVIFHFIRFNYNDTVQMIPRDGSFLKVECVFCDYIFTGPNMFTFFQQHFDYHQGELDWRCTHCGVVLSMEHIAKSKWEHDCQLLRLLLDKQSVI